MTVQINRMVQSGKPMVLEVENDAVGFKIYKTENGFGMHMLKGMQSSDTLNAVADSVELIFSSTEMFDNFLAMVNYQLDSQVGTQVGELSSTTH